MNEPNIKAAFDAWAPFLQGLSGDDLVRAVESVGSRIEFTTVADYVDTPQFRYDPGRVNYIPEGQLWCALLRPEPGKSITKAFSEDFGLPVTAAP